MAEQNEPKKLGNHKYKVNLKIKWFDIECYGGPNDGEKVTYRGKAFSWYHPSIGNIALDRHIYHYNHQSNTYEYKGVRK